MAHKCGGLRTSVYQACGDPSTREGFRSQSSRRTGPGREHGQYVLLAKPLQSSSFSESKHSHEQAKANTYALPLIVEAITRIDLAQIASEFRIADYGSAQGQNSLLPMKTAIAQIRTLAAKFGRATTPISVTHTDLPTNDWTTLLDLASDAYLEKANVRGPYRRCFYSARKS